MRVVLTILGLLVFSAPANAQRTEPKYEGKTLGYWLERLERGRTDAERDQAARAVGAFGKDGTVAVPILLEMTRDHSEAYRLRIYEVFASLGPGAKAAIPELAKRLDEKISYFKQHQWDLLATIDQESETTRLIQVLGKFGPEAKAAVPVIMAALPGERLADPAIHALCNIGPDANVAIPEIRLAIQRMIDDIETGNSSRDSIPDFELHNIGTDCLPVLKDILASKWIDPKDYVLRQLEKMTHADGKPIPEITLMLQKLLNDQDAQISLKAASALWKQARDKAVVSRLVNLLRSDNCFVARQAIVQLGDIGPDAKDALPTLRKLCEDKTNGSPGSDPLVAPAGYPPSTGAIPTAMSPEQFRRQGEVPRAARVAIRKISVAEKK